MPENHQSPLIINHADALPSNSISLPLKWNGLEVTYLSTSFSQYPIHNHRAIQTTIPLLSSGFEAVTLSAIGSRRESQKLSTENVIVTPAYQPHTLLWNGDTKLVMFDLEPEFIERAAGEALRGGEVDIRPERNVRDSFITQLGGALYSKFKNPSAVGGIYIESLAVALAVHLLRNYSVAVQKIREFSGGLSGVRLRRAIEYIDANLDQDLALAQIAETVGMITYYFSRALKKSTGFAPHAYVVHQRMTRAKKLLTETKISVTEIASAVGYANHCHFSTQFLKLVGVSPLAYRRK
jgi:AraC family transcriptional regulator